MRILIFQCCLFYVALAWVLIAFSALSGCGKKGDPDESFFEIAKKEKEHEKDTPWNHGYGAIMETDDGGQLLYHS